MQLDFTAEEEELRQSVRTVLERECAIGDVRALVEARVRGEETGDDGLDRRLWHTVVGLDWPALTVPEEHGGVGLGFVELAVLAEELGRSLAPGPLVPTITQLVPAIREAADDDQAGKLLAAVAAGTSTGTLAVAETIGRWDAAGIEASANAAAGEVVLSGRKRFVLEAGAVDEIVVAAREPGSSGDEGITLALVPAHDVTIEPIRSLDPTRRIGTVVLNDVRITSDRVLGPAGEAGAALRRAVEQATVCTALDIVGCCQAMFDTTLAYARDRVQFGAPIGSFQAVKHKLVNLFVALERARATAYFAVACIAEDDERRAAGAAMAKAAAGECQRLVASDAIQLLGGIGYTWEHDQHLYVKRAKAGDLLLGSAAAHRSALADALDI